MGTEKTTTKKNGQTNQKSRHLRQIRHPLRRHPPKNHQKMEVSQHKRWVNPYTGTQTLKRHSTGIWACKKSGVKIAGGAYVFETTSLKMMRRGIARQREAMQQ